MDADRNTAIGVYYWLYELVFPPPPDRDYLVYVKKQKKNRKQK